MRLSCCNIKYPVIRAGRLLRASVADIGGRLKPAACPGHILVAELFTGNAVPAGGITACILTESVDVADLPICTIWEHCDGPSSFRAFSGINFTLGSRRAFVDGFCYGFDREVIVKSFLYVDTVIMCHVCFRFVHVNPAFPSWVRPIVHIAIVLHICPRLNATPSKSVAFNLGKVHLLLNFTQRNNSVRDIRIIMR